MSGELQAEATGETVGEAKWQALRELERLRPGLDKTTVHFEILAAGERGLLGVGYTPARVVATVPDHGPAQPSAESEVASELRDLLERITETLGVRCRIDIEEREETIVASCSGPELGLLIGKHGQTIDAVQYLANAVAFRRQSDPRKPIVVDAAGYRSRREETLRRVAVRAAEQALASGSRVELDPMTAAERKIVHLFLQEVAGVETTSEGAEPNRYVVVYPARA